MGSRRFTLADGFGFYTTFSSPESLCPRRQRNQNAAQGGCPLKIPFDRFGRLYFWCGIHALILLGAREGESYKLGIVRRKRLTLLFFIWVKDCGTLFAFWEAGASPLLIVLVSTQPFLLQSPFVPGGIHALILIGARGGRICEFVVLGRINWGLFDESG